MRRGTLNPAVPLPRAGILHSWLIHDDAPTPGMPAFLESLPPGYYSSEGWSGLSSDYPFHALITPVPSGKLVTYM